MKPTIDACLAYADSLTGCTGNQEMVRKLAAEYRAAMKALSGLKTIVEMIVASPDGRQYAYAETRHGSFVHCTEALMEAETLIDALPAGEKTA